jgi:hypothetical protein
MFLDRSLGPPVSFSLIMESRKLDFLALAFLVLERLMFVFISVDMLDNVIICWMRW